MRNYKVTWRYNDKVSSSKLFESYAAALAFAIGLEAQGLEPTIHEVI